MDIGKSIGTYTQADKVGFLINPHVFFARILYSNIFKNSNPSLGSTRKTDNDTRGFMLPNAHCLKMNERSESLLLELGSYMNR